MGDAEVTTLVDVRTTVDGACETVDTVTVTERCDVDVDDVVSASEVADALAELPVPETCTCLFSFPKANSTLSAETYDTIKRPKMASADRCMIGIVCENFGYDATQENLSRTSVQGGQSKCSKCQQREREKPQ